MSLNLPKRTVKPRTSGLTMVLEKGLPYSLFSEVVKTQHQKIDIIKFTSGIGIVDETIKEKIELCREYQIITYLGGTLFEKFYHQGKLPEYTEYLKALGLKAIEISDGTLKISEKEKAALIKQYKDEGLLVLVEVGSKDTDFVMPPSVWLEQMDNALNAGADYLVVEGRESATAGLYRTSGEMRTGLLEEIIKEVDVERVLFEAPTKKSQCYLIEKISPNVNLANIPFFDVNILEVQRLGLRYDTFFVFEEKKL
jgi:phosphosulfolactate synthase